MPTPKTVSFARSIWGALFGADDAPRIAVGEAPSADAQALENERARIRRENPHGLYRGRHYTEFVDELSRLNRMDPAAAEELALHLVDATEAEAKARGWKPAPAYYERVAILRRKRKDYVGEVAILERHERWYAGGGKFAERLAKARGLAAHHK